MTYYDILRTALIGAAVLTEKEEKVLNELGSDPIAAERLEKFQRDFEEISDRMFALDIADIMIKRYKLTGDAIYNVYEYAKDLDGETRDEIKEAIEEYAEYQANPEKDWRYDL